MLYLLSGGALLPSVIGLLKDAALVRFISASELAHYLLLIFVIQSAVGVIANSLHLLAAGRFNTTGIAAYPVDRLSNLKTFAALMIALLVILLTHSFHDRGGTPLVFICGISVLYFFSCLLTSFLNGLLSASNVRLYVVVPVCTHIVLVLVALLLHPNAVTLLAGSVLGAFLEALILCVLLRRAHVGLRIKLSPSFPPPRTAAVSALLNAASPFVIQLAAYGLGPVSFLALVYGQKIANMLATIGAAIVGATYFHLNFDARAVRTLTVSLFGLSMVAVVLAQVLYPFPLQTWLGEALIKRVGSDLHPVYMCGWGMLACHILASVCYRKCLIESPKSLMFIKAVALFINLGALLAVHWGVVALVAVQLSAALIEVALLVRVTNYVSNARVPSVNQT